MTAQSDKNNLLAWALGFIVTINTTVVLWAVDTLVELDKSDVKKTEQITNIRADDDKQNLRLEKIEAVLFREDRYWKDEKKRPNHIED